MKRYKVPPEQSAFIEGNSTVVTTERGDKWYFIPFWYKATEIPDTYVIYPFEKLPDDFKEAVMKQREGVGVSANSVTTTNKSIIERMVPLVDAMNIAHLKLQKGLCNANHGTKPTSIDPTKE